MQERMYRTPTIQDVDDLKQCLSKWRPPKHSKNLHFVLDTLLFVVNIRRHYCLIGWAIKWSSKLLFISIPNRPIYKFDRFIFQKAVSIFVKIWKKLQLTFLGHPVYYEMYSCCKYSWVFLNCVFNQFFCIIIIIIIYLFLFSLYFFSVVL